MNVCESGDFYCSKKCNPQTDSDCAVPLPQAVSVPEPEKSVEEKIAEFEEEVRKELPAAEIKNDSVIDKKLSSSAKILIYVLIYIFGFVAVKVVRRKKR
jgi:hypothetical protein